ncbi:rCG20451 [Rattus norvegicus]|uniref:RCG20451 n=1 Tax=Rattus norvegicus TaxID=10116 RepID=A6JGV2_RAT|nr:rCG20451 [Rattus norvegicus]
MFTLLSFSFSKSLFIGAVSAQRTDGVTVCVDSPQGVAVLEGVTLLE